MQPGAIEFQWLAAESEVSSTVTVLTESGVDAVAIDVGPAPSGLLGDTEDAEFEPLLLIAGAAAVGYLVRSVSRVLRDHRQGGVVIDTRGERLTIRNRVRGVNAGTVVLVGDGGVQMLSAPDDETLHRMFTS